MPWCNVMTVRVSCRVVNLRSNQLSGSIPSTLGNLTALRRVWRGGRVCDWVYFSVGCVCGAQSYAPSCVWRACTHARHTQ